MIVHMALKSIAKMESDVQCTALWHREADQNNAEELQKEYGIQKLYTDFDGFLKDDTFDTAYVGVINSLHYEYTKKALLAGKNVICEKPFMPSGKEAQELLDLAKEKNLFLFEAIMLRYTDNYELIRSMLPELGDLKMIQCNYSQYSSRYDSYLARTVLPAFDPKFAGGCIYDINIYCIHFVMGLFGKPKSYQYFPNVGYNGIDTSGILILDYGTFKAVCTGAKDSNSKPGCMIQGVKGYIHVDSMPGQVENVSIVYNKTEPKTIGGHCEDMMVNEFTKINEIVNTRNFEKCYQYMEQTVEVMETVEKARRTAGIIFENEY